MNTLVSIAPSHYCEKTRWSLELAEIPFTEQIHVPFFHVSAVKKVGGTRSTPVLKTDSALLDDSTLITQWIAEQPNIAWSPFGHTENEKERSQHWEHELGRKLGVLTRLVAYHHLLPAKQQIQNCMQRAPHTEQQWFGWGYPIFAWMMRRGMNINAKSAQQATKSIWKIFEDIEQNVTGEYLVGNQLTIADLTLAALSAPLILPAKYGAPLPSLEDIPVSAKDLCLKLRAHPTGQRVLRLYDNWR